MKNYSNGLTTKEKIIEVSKELFYEKGYKSTTFAEICAQSQVNPGSIAYHFGTKRNIALEIYKAVLKNLTEKSEELFPDLDPIQQQMLAHALYLKLVYIDEAFRQFLAQLLSEAEYDDLTANYMNFVPKAYLMTRNSIDQNKADFLFAIFMGMDSYIITYIDRHMDELSLDEAVRYCIELYYLFIDHIELEERINTNSKLINKIDLQINGFDVGVNLVTE